MHLIKGIFIFIKWTESTGKINQFQYVVILLPLICKHANCKTHTILWKLLFLEYEMWIPHTYCMLDVFAISCAPGVSVVSHLIFYLSKQFDKKGMTGVKCDNFSSTEFKLSVFLCPWHDNFSFYNVYKQTLNWHIGWHVYTIIHVQVYIPLNKK